MKKTTSNATARRTTKSAEAHQTVTPYLIVDSADQLIDFIEKAFDGELQNMTRDDRNRVMHAVVKIGNTMIFVSDNMGTMPSEVAMLYVYLDDVDGVYKKATEAGGESLTAPADQVYGDYAGAVKDQWGNKWWIAKHTEDLSDDEIRERAKKAYPNDY